jgi:hypothetical protein
MNGLLLTLFEKYAELLKKRFSEDFQEIVNTDDYMPMPIKSIEEYDKVVTVSWYEPETERQDLECGSFNVLGCVADAGQISARFTVFPDVSTLLHRYPEFPQPDLSVCR